MPTSTHQPAITKANPTSVGLLQRKCAGCKKDEEEKKRLGIQTKLKVSQPGDPLEREADRVADEVLRKPAAPTRNNAAAAVPHIQRRAKSPSSSTTQNTESGSVISNAGSARPLPVDVRADFESRFNEDFSGVKIHTDSIAARSAESLNAKAYTLGSHVVFGNSEFSPSTTTGRQLLAHELTHVLQQRNRGGSHTATAMRKTKGETTFDRGRAWLDQDAEVKKHVDVLKAALAEIRKGKSVAFNLSAGKRHIKNLAGLLSLKPKQASQLQRDWNWFGANRGSKNFSARKRSLLVSLRSPLKEMSVLHPRERVRNDLKQTPVSVFELIHEVSDAEIPPEDLYAFATNEGVTDTYIRDQLALGEGVFPTPAELATVKTTEPLSGFVSLGVDDFMSDLDARRHPTRPMLPKGFDVSALTPDHPTNEKNSVRQSADFPNLKIALQGLVVVIKRRRRLFKEDAAKFGYSTPTANDLVYFTYLYFNPGEGAGKKTLRDHKGNRRLSDWAKTKFFPNARKVLTSYRMIKALKIF